MQIDHPDYNSPASLKAFLGLCNMSMQKKFGQNFLINESARIKITGALLLEQGMDVWEIGPGLGSMTELILSAGARLTAFEIDRGFLTVLPRFFFSAVQEGRFTLIEGDVMKTWQECLNKNGQPRRLFGNLPYNIAAAFIASTIENGVRFERCVVTVQKEVARRMNAEPGTADYSSFSVLCKWAYDVKPLMDLGGGSFWPRPNVDSRAVVLTRKQDYPCCLDPMHFVRMQRAVFASRRKTIKNNLIPFLPQDAPVEEILHEAGIEPETRGESLTVRQLLRLSDCCPR